MEILLHSIEADGIKRVAYLGGGMGLEMVLLLVDQPALERLLNEPWKSLYSGMESGAYRSVRPEADPRLNRPFDIDAEAEILDWMDAYTIEGNPTLLEALKGQRQGAQGLLHFMHYASPGAWEVWEGRAFLYLDVALGEAVANVDALYGEDTWMRATRRLAGLPEDEFSESVCLDWMERRKELGETLDEKEDPKIVPTYEAHDRASRLLVHAVSRWIGEGDLVGVLGREHLPAGEWGHGPWNLAAFLNE
jgi:hypothetical protein